MPWEPSDALKHKKGLTEKQQRQWAHIANSARAKCIADGGDEATCDVSAIRQANGVVGSNEKGIQRNFHTFTVPQE